MDDKRKVRLLVEVTAAERRRVKVKAAKEGKSTQSILYRYVQLYLSTKGKKK
jgi:hypothetical protein